LTKGPDFDVAAAHKHFAAHCFNKAWDLIDKTDRTPEEDAEMIRLNQASHWHWTQRDDCKKENLSVGYWQASRIYAILGEAENARKYGELCLSLSEGEDPFYLGYAYEALARAESVAGNHAKMEEHLADARRTAEKVEKPDFKEPLITDIDSIK